MFGLGGVYADVPDRLLLPVQFNHDGVAVNNAEYLGDLATVVAVV